MKKIMQKLFGFGKKLGRDERGEDLTESSSSLSTMGKGVIAAAVITGVAMTAATRTQDAANTGDTVARGINQTVNANSGTTNTGGAAFGRR